MAHENFDLDALRTFCVGMELGNFAKAADRLNRSTSAVSAQLKKLEEQAGTAIVRKSGRGLALTEAGEVLLGYARRMLELNDEARLALEGMSLQGRIRLGLQEDFGEHLLADILGRFTRACSSVIVETRVARNAELVSMVQSGDLDLALAWQTGKVMPYVEPLGRHPLQWIGPADPALVRWQERHESLPLVMFDSGCAIRAMATAALDQAGIPWRIAFTSPSLASVWAAVSAGLGITVRTRFGMPGSLRVLAHEGLPALPGIELALLRAGPQLGAVGERMCEIICERILASEIPDLPAHMHPYKDRIF